MVLEWAFDFVDFDFLVLDNLEVNGVDLVCDERLCGLITEYVPVNEATLETLEPRSRRRMSTGGLGVWSGVTMGLGVSS